jgi:hypothetical protein
VSHRESYDYNAPINQCLTGSHTIIMRVLHTAITSVLDNHKGSLQFDSEINNYRYITSLRIFKIMYFEFNAINLYFALTGNLQTSTTLLVVFMFH